MIIERVTAIRCLQPREIVAHPPLRASVRVVGSGERQVSEGTTGNILDVSYEDIEVDLYQPSDLIRYAQNITA